MLSRLTDVCLARPRAALLAGLLVAVLFASGLPQLELRTDSSILYPVENPVVQQSVADAERFREPDQILLLISARLGGPPVASVAGLRFLDEIDRQLRGLPVLDAERVRSLASLLEPDPGLSSLQLVQEYLQELPANPAEVAALRVRVRRHPLGEGLFLAADGSAAAVYASVAAGVQRREAVEALEDWLRGRGSAGAAFDLRLTGPAVAEVLLGRQVLRDLARNIPVMVLVMALLLYGCLGTPGAVTAVMVEVFVVLVCVLGAMGHAGVPITLVTTILPVVVMVLAMADEIHFLERLQAFQTATADPSPAGRRIAAAAALRQMGRPMVLTSLTTAAGFLAFPTSDIAPLRDFGIFAAAGILLAMLSSFTLIPALVVLLPGSWWRRRRWSARADVSLSPFYAWVWRRERAALTLGLGLLAALLPGSLRLSVQDSWIENFDRDSTVAAADRIFNASFWGTYRFDVVLESQEPRFFRLPAGIALVDEVAREAAAAPHSAGVVSHLAPLQVLAAMTGRPGDVARLPADDLRTLTALATLLRSSLDLDAFLSRDERAARVRILVKDADYQRGTELREHLRRRLAPLARSHGVRLHMSGDLPVALEVVRTILTDQLGSIAWSLAGIALLLLVVFRRPADVAVLLAPVIAAAGLVFGGLGYLGVPLGIASSMFLALSIGSGTDFALHFFHAYREVRDAGSEHTAAVGQSLATAGRAVRWNAVVLGLGFLILTLSSLPPNRVLGLLLAAAMLAAYLMTVLLLPWLLRWTKGSS